MEKISISRRNFIQLATLSAAVFVGGSLVPQIARAADIGSYMQVYSDYSRKSEWTTVGSPDYPAYADGLGLLFCTTKQRFPQYGTVRVENLIGHSIPTSGVVWTQEAVTFFSLALEYLRNTVEEFAVWEMLTWWIWTYESYGILDDSKQEDSAGSGTAKSTWSYSIPYDTLKQNMLNYVNERKSHYRGDGYYLAKSDGTQDSVYFAPPIKIMGYANLHKSATT